MNGVQVKQVLSSATVSSYSKFY